MPKVSVIIPTYNYGKHIRKAIDSVLAQTYQDIEIIVVDDGSTDDTRKIIQSNYGSHVRYFFQENIGAPAARNLGIKRSSGEYIIFLDADDFLDPNQVSLFMSQSKKYPDTIIYGPWIKFLETDTICTHLYSRGKFEGKDMLESWLGGWFIASCAIFWPRKIITALDGWDETLKANQDGDLGMRALISGYKFQYCPNAFAYIKGHPTDETSISTNYNSLDCQTSRLIVLNKIENLLNQNGNAETYRKPLSFAYYSLARQNALAFPDLAKKCYTNFRKLSKFRKPPGSFLNWIGVLLIGIQKKEKLASNIYLIRKKILSLLSTLHYTPGLLS